jgi:hypothetical protein
MTRGRHRGTTRRPSRAKPKAPTDSPLEEAKAILRDVEGTAALNEVMAFAVQNRRQAARANRQAKLQGLASFARLRSAMRCGVRRAGNKVGLPSGSPAPQRCIRSFRRPCWHFRQARPGVRVELDEAGTAELVKAMLEGRLDAAFVRSPVGSIAD